MKNIKLLRSFFFFLTGLFITVFTVNAATENITQIAFTTPPHEVDAGVVSPVLTVQTRNATGTVELGLDEGQVLGESVFLFLHDIGLGSRLEPDVSELQSRLAREGYYAGPQLGYFGRYTEMRLRAYQAANDLTPSGRLDVATRAILNNNDPTVLSQNAFQVLLDLLELEQ